MSWQHALDLDVNTTRVTRSEDTSEDASVNQASLQLVPDFDESFFFPSSLRNNKKNITKNKKDVPCIAQSIYGSQAGPSCHCSV